MLLIMVSLQSVLRIILQENNVEIIRTFQAKNIFHFIDYSYRFQGYRCESGMSL